MSGIEFEPDTEETRRKHNELARHQAITRLLKDILFDMQVCEIEGWDPMEYPNQIYKAIEFLLKKEKQR